MSVGSRIKQAREERKLTQKELAKKAGVTTSAITNYETGVSHPKEPVLIRLIEVLEVDANFLFQDEAPATAGAQTSDMREALTRIGAIRFDGSVDFDRVEAIANLIAAGKGVSGDSVD